MIHFHEELVKLAQKVIDAKSTFDDIKATKDINEILFAINTAQPTIQFVEAAKQLDRKINEDYPEIAEMHVVASNMANALGIINNENSQSEYDAILQDLNSDIYGICASILLKHEKISCIKDFIEWVD